MFKRRQNLDYFQKAQSFIWPRSGWKRASLYALHRLARLRGTPHALAGGFAFGAAVSFMPFVGFHFVLGGAFAWIFRCNILASAIGTAVGNPWTFPFIWVLVYETGQWMLGMSGSHAAPVDFGAALDAATAALWSLDIAGLLAAAGPVFWPMLVGSLPHFVIVWLVFYFPLKTIIQRFQARRQLRLQRKAAKAAERRPVGGHIQGGKS